MKIKILNAVNLDFSGELKLYEPSKKIYTIKESVALDNDYYNRYLKAKDYIEIIAEEVEVEEVEPEVEPEVEITNKPKPKPKPKNKKSTLDINYDITTIDDKDKLLDGV